MLKNVMKITVIMILVIITLCPQFSYAKEIYEENGVPVRGAIGIAGGDDIFVAEDLEVPNERISSIDVNENGELLVCFKSRIMVFDNKYTPIKAFDIWWGRGDGPATVWNDETERIVYVRGDGYEINDEGDVVYFYGDIEEAYFFKTTGECNGVKYRLENRIPLRSIYTYSTLIMTDENGKETVLHNALLSQFLEVLPANTIPPTLIIIFMISFLRWRKNKKKTEEELAKEAEEEKQREIEAMEIAEKESKKTAESITDKYK